VFPAPASFTVRSLQSSDFTINPTFDGQTVTDLLAAGSPLGIGQTGLIQVVVHVIPGAGVGPYTLSSTARGTSPAGTPVTDVSMDGDNPDPDGDSDPTNNNLPTVIELPGATPQIPTLETWGFLVLAAFLSLVVMRRLKRREERATPAA